jgi:insulysin
MIIPKNETRTFKYGKLDNNLKYTIIHDINTDESNMVVYIKAGYIYDPKEYMGLAHFLEHMLFMGSHKYPDEKYFFTKITEYGGYSNAYTDSFQTVYYLNVMSEYLENIMDIFSRFFIDPLFNINSVEREINAVNSEHLKNINDRSWIERQIILNSIDSDHITNTFGTGNHETFGKDYVKIRDVMIEFYNSYYRANNMSIVITTNKSIAFVDNLIHKYFNDVKEKSIKFTKIDQLNHKLFSNTLNEYQILTKNSNNYIIYYWDVKIFTYYIKNDIINVIINAIKLNCKYNLNNQLIELNYSTGIEINYLDIGIFTLKVYLHSNKYIVQVNNIVQHYFNTLHEFDWDTIYNWMRESHRFIFNYDLKLSNIDLANKIAHNMHYFDEKYIYSGAIELKNTKDHLSEIIKTLKLLKFKNVNIIYGTSKPLDSTKIKTEKYYKAKYYKLKKSFIKNYKLNCQFNININKTNHTCFKLLNIKPTHINNLDTKTKIGLNVPIQLTKRFWYGGVSKFKDTFVFGRVFIDYKPFYNNVKSYLLTLLALDIINYYIQLTFCLELMLGYTITLNMVDECFNIVISGYNQANDLEYIDFFNNVLYKLKQIKPDKSIIKMHIKQLKQNIKNIKLESPWNYSSMILNEMIFKNVYNYKDKLIALETIDNIQNYSSILNRIDQIINFKDIPVVTIIYGNIKSDNLHKCYTYNLNNHIKIEKLDRDNLVHNKIVRHPNKNEKNKCITFIFNCGSGFYPDLSAKLYILKTLLEHPAFNELRTKQQLGYLVRTTYICNDNNYIYIKLQSHYSTDKIITAMNNFIDWFSIYLNNLNNKEFNAIKLSLYNSLNQKESSISNLVNKYISEIYTHKYIFNRKQLIANEIKNIKLNDIRKLYHSIIKKKSIIQIC